MNWQEALKRFSLVLSVPILLFATLGLFNVNDNGTVILGIAAFFLALLWATYYAIIWIAAGFGHGQAK